MDGSQLTQCRHCGEARDKTDASTPVRSLGVGEAPSSAAEAAAAERAERQAAARSRVADRVARQGSLGRRSALAAPRSLRAAVLAGLAVLLLAAFAFWAWPRTHEGRVAELNWTRSIAVERLGTYVEEGWTLPQGARQIGAERRVRSYRDVVDYYEARTRQVAYDVPSGMESYSCGSTDLGNGYFQDRICTRTTYRTEYRTETYQAPVYRQEPVYDTWLTWEEDHWEVVRTPVAQGGDTTPEWPAVDLHNREREGARTEELVAVLEDEDGRTRMTLPPETWTALDVGDPVRWRHGPVTGTDLLLEP